MISLENAELLTQVVQEIAYTAPEGWKKIVYYQEMLADSDGSLRNKSTAKCWCDTEMSEYSRGFEIGGSMEAFEAVEEFYEDTKRKGEAWKGMLLTIFEDGKYNTQLFYDTTPLLDGESEKVDEIISSAE